MVNMRHVIFQAANHIEKNPGEFKFSSIRIPKSPNCGSPACALGWIACFAGEPAGASGFGTHALRTLGCDTTEFYKRMNHACEKATGDSPYNWMMDAEVCAKSLRVYADQYHAMPLNRWLMDIIPGTGDGEVFESEKEVLET